jgi:acyl carrier protein
VQTETTELDELVGLIREVKPSVAGKSIGPNDSIVETLGLDSLDLLQLVRKVRRKLRPEFDLDSWQKRADEHNYAVGSVLEGTEVALADA